MKSLTNIFLLIESSENMQCSAVIDAINSAVPELLNYIRVIANYNESIHIKYSVLKFADNAHWLNIGTNIDQLQWIDIDVGGKCCRGKAYEELGKILTREENDVFTTHCNRPPIIILITASKSVDNVSKSLISLKHSTWFNNSVKFVIDLSGNVDKKELIEFTGCGELIMPYAFAFELLKKEIKALITSPLVS